MPVLIFKTHHGVGSGYMRNRLSPITSVWPIRAGKGSMLQVPSVRELHVGGSQKVELLDMVPILWNLFSLEVKLAPSLSTFHNSLKTWLCYQSGTISDTSLTMINIILSCLCIFLIIIFNCDCFYVF